MKKRFITWNYVEQIVDKIIYEVNESNFNPKYILGLPRGGVIPAVMMSHKMDIPYITLNYLTSGINYNDVLLIDDIADTGETLEKNKHYISATLFYKPQSIIKPLFYGEEVDNDLWISFPWEKPDAETIADYLK